LKAQVNVDMMPGHVSMYTLVGGGGGGVLFFIRIQVKGVIEFFCDVGGAGHFV
jgi:hypothetical protein